MNLYRPSECSGSDPLQHRIVTVTLDGEWRADALEDLRRQLERMIAKGWRGLVLDLRNVVHLDYRAVRKLTTAAQASRRVGGDLKLVGVSDYLRLILRAAGAHEDFEVHPDQESAWAAFGRTRAPTLH